MEEEYKENGTRQLVWLPNNLFEITETVRKKFGMSRSGFYRYAVTQLLQQLSVLSTKAKEETLESIDEEDFRPRKKPFKFEIEGLSH